METLIGPYLRNERERRGLSRQALAARLGYKNLNKGARWIERIEAEGLENESWKGPLPGRSQKVPPVRPAGDLDIGRAPPGRWGVRRRLLEKTVAVLGLDRAAIEKLLAEERRQEDEERRRRLEETKDHVPVALLRVIVGGITVRIPLPKGLTRDSDLSPFWAEAAEGARVVMVEYGPPKRREPPAGGLKVGGLRINRPGAPALTRIAGRATPIAFEIDEEG